MIELPNYGLRAYAFLYSRNGSRSHFKQSELNGIVSLAMKKKIFALLLHSKWIVKSGKRTYRCISPEQAILGLLKPRALEVLKASNLPYVLTGASALQLWDKHTTAQRHRKSKPNCPYFIKVLKKDLQEWKNYLNNKSTPNYVENGTTVGDFIVLIPVNSLRFAKKHGVKVERLWETIRRGAST
ncbi:MAG: hypothetical protein V1722_05190 [Candidatus Micrarchaeota archaeon]